MSDRTSLAAKVAPAPRLNTLLAALPQEDLERLRPHLESVPLPMGCTVHGAGEREKFLYFPTSGIVSRFYVMESGASAGFSLIGNEGVIGVALLLGAESTPSQAVVLSPGHAYRISANLLQTEFDRHSALILLLLRYTQALVAQIGQIAACNRHHSTEQQLCRWLLSCLDRQPSSEVAFTHELIASMVGVRRESITDAAAALQREGLIHCRRGHIDVLDRVRLESAACECHAVVKAEFDRLFRPASATGKTGSFHLDWPRNPAVAARQTQPVLA